MQEVLLKHAEFVRKNEPGVLHFEITRGVDRAEGSARFVVWEVYQDEAARKAHGETAGLAVLLKHFQEEQLVSVPTTVYITESQGGVANWP